MLDLAIDREKFRDILGLTEQQMNDAEREDARRRTMANNLNLPTRLRAYAVSMRFRG